MLKDSSRPTGGVAAAILFFTLNLNPHGEGKTFKQHVAEFDFVGLLLIVAGLLMLLVGFNESQNSWTSKTTLVLLILGSVTFVSGGVNEVYTTRSPIIPPRLFRTRTTTILLVTTFLHAMAFFAAAYYLPLYFQVLGASATRAGIEMLPFSLGVTAMSAVTGILLSRNGRYRPIMWIAYVVYAVGMGLMIMLDSHSSRAAKVLYPLIASIGLGSIIQTPLIALQAAMPIKDMATSTGTYGFIRTLGGTVGISLGQAIFSSILRKKIIHIPNLTSFDTSPAGLSGSVRYLKNIPDPVTRIAVIQAYTISISTIWLVMTPIIGVAFFMSLFIRHYTLNRTVVLVGRETDEDVESKPGTSTCGAHVLLYENPKKTPGTDIISQHHSVAKDSFIKGNVTEGHIIAGPTTAPSLSFKHNPDGAEKGAAEPGDDAATTPGLGEQADDTHTDISAAT